LLPTARAFCCADILSSVSLEQKLMGRTNIQVLFICSSAFRQPNMQLISDLLLMFILSENRLLAA
jgi:hypothetical protein